MPGAQILRNATFSVESSTSYIVDVIADCVQIIIITFSAVENLM